MSKKRLYKSNKSKMICGVCGGIADYFNIDPTIVRIIAVIIGCLKGAGLLIYILACIIIPSNPEEQFDDDVDNMKSANVDSSEKQTKSKSKEKDDDKEKKSIHSDSDFDSFFK